MSGIPWEKEENQNHTRWLYIMNAVKKELRDFFIRKWNNTSHGPWDDTSVSGQKLFNLEQSRPRPNKTMFQSEFQHGDTNKWDFTVLFDAILFSNSIGSSLTTTEKTEIDNIRVLRNKLTHVLHQNIITKTDFQDMATIVETALTALGLSVNEVLRIKNLFASFIVLPLEPAHEVVSRSDKIREDLEKLRSDNDGKLTYFYISGNPGSGKSQLARQVCEDIYKDIHTKDEAMFVMTLNGKDIHPLYDSYIKFCGQLKCEESKLQSVLASLKPIDQKIEDLRTEVSLRIKNWKKWWIIVDNVEDLQLISKLLPLRGNKVWNNGQIILTTQNTYAVPLDSLTKHISLSYGMNDEDCRKLLSLIPKADVNDPSLLDEVAKKLDRQPLAMAAAAVYMSKIIENPSNSPWQDYLKKLDKSGREKAEKNLKQTNSGAYPFTMSEAALETIRTLRNRAENDVYNILQQTFSLFSLISFEPLPFLFVVKYIQEQQKEIDDDEILLAIKQCSLFVYVGNKERDIRLHRFVHETIKQFCRSKEYQCVTSFENEILKVLKTMYYFKDRADITKLIPHLKAFNTEITQQLPNHELKSATFNTTEISEIHLFYAITLNKFKEFQLSTDFLQRSLKSRLEHLGSNHHTEVASSCNDYVNGFCADDLKREHDYCEQVLQILQPSKLNHSSIATCYNHVGSLYCKIGDLEQASRYFQQALKIQLEQFGRNHIDVALSYNNLGTVYRDKGDLKNATDYYQQALKILLEKLGKNHIDVARLYHNLGIVCSKKGDLKEACDFYERALKIYSQQF